MGTQPYQEALNGIVLMFDYIGITIGIAIIGLCVYGFFRWIIDISKPGRHDYK